jgi:uncharacterized membrane protein YhhN
VNGPLPGPHRLRWGAAAAVAAVDAVSAGRGARRVAKPLVVPAVAYAAGVRGGPPGLALAASWAGDVALLRTSEAGLLGGIGGFAVAHGAYLTALRRRGAAPGWPALAVTAAAAPLLWPRLPARDRLPVLAYAGLVGATGAAAVRTGERPRGARGILFVLSDALVAVSLFGPRRRPAVDAAVMATYAAAQALLAAGLSGGSGRPGGGRGGGRPGGGRRWRG